MWLSQRPLPDTNLILAVCHICQTSCFFWSNVNVFLQNGVAEISSQRRFKQKLCRLPRIRKRRLNSSKTVAIQSLWWLGFGMDDQRIVQFPLGLEMCLFSIAFIPAVSTPSLLSVAFFLPHGREAARWFPCNADVNSEMNCTVRCEFCVCVEGTSQIAASSDWCSSHCQQ
jgi:hypothetical protein